MAMLHRSMVVILLPSPLPIAQVAKQEARPATLKQDFDALFVKPSDWQQSLTSTDLKAMQLDDPWLNRLTPKAFDVHR
jgi:hypothetical protein